MINEQDYVGLIVMTRLLCAAAVCALAMGTAAQAQSIDVIPSAGSTTQLGDTSSVQQPAGSANLTDGSRGLNYSSTFSVTSAEVSFQGGGIGVGDQTRTTSTSRVDLTITNNGDGQLNPLLKSQLTAAGMGVYLGDNTAGNCFSSPGSCAQSQGVHTLSQLGQTTGASSIAGVTVDFQILQGDSTLYHVSGGIEINQDGPVFVFSNTEQLASQLNGFVTLDQFGNIDPTTGKSNSALGFAWDATDITLNNLDPIGGFSSSTISYIVTVSTFNNANCFSDSTCLVTYAGFGDPIGRGGDVTNDALRVGGNSFLGAFGFGANDQGGPNFIGGVNFAPETLVIPHFDADGNIDFGAPGGGAVPEPATWAMLIMGFGLLGGALRRRRALAAA